MKLQEKQKKQAGITLVALVVTIIILIILATISIRMVIGEGGLIWQANNAKVEYRAATVDEEVLSWKAEKQVAEFNDKVQPQARDKLIDDQLTRGLLTPEEAETAKRDGQVKIGSRTINYGENETSGTTDPPTEPPTPKLPTIAEAIEGGEAFAKDENRQVTDGDKNMWIPQGFTVVDPEIDDSVEYNDNNDPKVDEGVVVKDGAGNQFVWVPVPDINNMAKKQDGNGENWEGKLYNFQKDEAKGSTSTEMTNYGVNTTSYREPGVVSGSDGTAFDRSETFYKDELEFNSSEEFEEHLQNEFNRMVTSVNKYKGFYIGRYETSGLNTSTPIVQKDKTPTTDINWYKMYKNSKKVAKEGSSVTSSMIWGCQWDAVMNWFIDCGGETAKYVTDSTDKGNYETYSSTGSKIIIPTGSNSAYRISNIYDLAGNVGERTLEAYSNRYRVSRGYHRIGGGSSSQRDLTIDVHYGFQYVGSRVTLYVN